MSYLPDAGQGRATGRHVLVEAGSQEKQRQRQAECHGRHGIAPGPADLCLQVDHQEAGDQRSNVDHPARE